MLLCVRGHTAPKPTANTTHTHSCALKTKHKKNAHAGYVAHVKRPSRTLVHDTIYILTHTVPECLRACVCACTTERDIVNRDARCRSHTHTQHTHTGAPGLTRALTRKSLRHFIVTALIGKAVNLHLLYLECVSASRDVACTSYLRCVRCDRVIRLLCWHPVRRCAFTVHARPRDQWIRSCRCVCVADCCRVCGCNI